MRVRSLFVTLMGLTLAVAVLTTPVAAQGGAQAARPGAPAMSKVLASVQGVWLFTHMNGEDVTGSGQEIAVTITNNKYVQTVNGQVVEQGTFTIDDTKKPWTIDIVIVEGDDAGKTQLGVVQLSGDTMVGKLADPGLTTRPTDFAHSEGAFAFTAARKKK